MCCGGRICMFCICLVIVVVAIGFLFGFGVFKHGFHKIEDTVHWCDPAVLGSSCGSGRPFLGYPLAVPPPF